MKLVMIKIIFEVLLVPNKRVFRIQVNYVTVYRLIPAVRSNLFRTYETFPKYIFLLFERLTKQDNPITFYPVRCTST